ncbi:MAG TPA: MG2 domain-containing protein, partial [Dongiaceae bacterium]|nr:MG2 domain-containing protein [Dongiaceae bacterium]
ATKLTVLVNIPEGHISGRASIDVIFDRPVVAMGSQDPSLQKGREILRIDPEPKGYYHWVGTRTLTFVVNGGLPLATHYTARVQKGLKAADGSMLDHDVAWEFETPRPRLVKSIPAVRDSFIRPEDPFFLNFNQAIDPHANAHAFELEDGPGLVASRPDSIALASAGWNYDREPLDHILLLKPRSALDIDHPYTLRIKKSLRGTQGSLDLGKDTTLAFRTYGRPGVLGVDARDVIEITFSTPIEADSVRRFIHLEPAPKRTLDPSWRTSYGSEKQITIRGLEPSTDYRVTINRGLKDIFGQTLTEGRAFSVRTSPREPFIDILPNASWQTAVLPLNAKREAILRYTGLTEIELYMEAIDPETEALLRSDWRSLYHDRGAFETLYKGKADEDVVTRAISLERFVASGRPGAVLIMAKGQGIGPRGVADVKTTAMIRFSDLGVMAKSSPEAGLAWATSLRFGSPKPDTRFSMVGGEHTRWNEKADANGMVTLPGIPTLPRGAFVVAISGEDAALANMVGDSRLSPLRRGIPSGEWSSATDHKAFIYSDRDLYRPGDIVHVSGLVRRILSSGIRQATLDSLHITVEDPEGNYISDTMLGLDQLGGFASDIPLPAQTKSGSYSVEVSLPAPSPSVDTPTIGRSSFTVAAYRAPAFQVTARINQPTVTAGDRIQARIQAKYFFGFPVAKGRLRWTLTRDRKGIQPAGYEGFSFGDPQATEPEGAVLGSGGKTLDGSGSADINVKLPEKPLEGFEQLTFEGGVSDPTGDTVNGRAIITYSPASVVPGIETPRQAVSTSEAVSARIVVLRADTALVVPGVPLELTLIRQDWKTVRKPLVGGRIGYKSSTRDTVIATQTAVSARDPITVSWKISTPGS